MTDEHHADRRSFLRTGAIAGTALVAGASGAIAQPVANTGASNVPLTKGDIDIANFALNLEYLEAEFYLRAAFGTGLPHNEVTGTGTLGPVSGGRKVPFKNPRIAAYAQEIANDEHSHVKFFRAVTGAAKVARPALNLDTSFTMAARAAGIIGPHQTFDAYADDLHFLLAAYIFEDVGVTAFHGAAPLIQSKAFLLAAAGILAVEAYHAGLIRTVLFGRGFDQAGEPIFKATAGISKLRRFLSGANDDQGIGPEQSTLAGGPETPSNIIPTDANGIAFARNPRQVLNIVYGAKDAHEGLFFPGGLNGAIH